MFKNIFILIFISLFLVSCWDSNTNTWLIKTETENISISIPSNWKIIESTKDILPKAKYWEIEFAVMSENVVNGFSNNLLILSDTLNKYTTSKEFSMLNNIWAQTDYIDYTKISSKDITFTDEEVSTLYIFDAKYNLDTPKLKFLQTAHICNQNKAYFLTLAIPTTIKDTTKYEYLLSTFNCK
jgi:hypothetical protein